MSNNSSPLNILFIEGYCQVPWMESSFMGRPPFGRPRPPTPPFPGRHSVFRVWCGHPSDLNQENAQPDAFGVKRCQKEIRSGKYHVIVVIDYSSPDLVKKFERDFGKLLQNFARAGGVVAFPSSEGLIVSTLQDFFDVEWKLSNYYRTTWGPCLEDNESTIIRNFGCGTLSRNVIKNYSAKAVSMRVPKHERCFGVTKDSTTQSMVPFMSGLDRSKKDGEDDYDVVVAVHDFGQGVIAYFGDVNAEDQTIALVAAFVESRAPTLPIESDMDSALPGDRVVFHGLVGAAHLNGTEGKLINFIESEQRWCVRCLGENAKVSAKPENLKIQFD